MIEIREATLADSELIIELIAELAEYEKLASYAQAKPTDIAAAIEDKLVSVWLADWHDGNTTSSAGFCLFFRTFSTFTGRPGIYLEDLYVRPQFRGRGIGLELLASLAKLVVDKQYTRLDWQVLDWNQPAIEFYQSLGAKHLQKWHSYRLMGEALHQLAACAATPSC